MATVERLGNGTSFPMESTVVANGTNPVNSKAVITYVASQLPTNATTEKAGLVKQTTEIANLTGETVTVEDFNGLLNALKTAGIMYVTPPEPEEE